MPEMEYIKLFAANGPWALLFVGLLYYVMRDARQRETRLMLFMETVAPRLQAVEDKLDATTAVAVRIEQAVMPCDTRRAVEKPRRATP